MITTPAFTIGDRVIAPGTAGAFDRTLRDGGPGEIVGLPAGFFAVRALVGSAGIRCLAFGARLGVLLFLLLGVDALTFALFRGLGGFAAGPGKDVARFDRLAVERHRRGRVTRGDEAGRQRSGHALPFLRH